MHKKLTIVTQVCLFCSLLVTGVVFAQNYIVAPVIRITESTRQLTQTTQPPRQAITIVAEVVAANPFVPLSVQLYYRTAEIDYQNIEMSQVTDTLWSGIIPAIAVVEPYVEFYVRVEDGLAFATDPQFNAQDVPYRIQISATNPDQEPPFIELSTATSRLILPSHSHPMSTALPISAYVLFDPMAQSRTVTLFWRQLGQTEYFSSPMTATGSDIWQATIPDSAVRAPEIEFFILASDNNAVTTTPEVTPQERPYVITISTTFTGIRPVFVQLTDDTYDIIRRYQPSNVDITISAEVVDDRGRQPHSVRCAYRILGALAYKHFSMQAQAGNTWSVRINADDVLKPGVQFYITALFDDETVTAPSTFQLNDSKKDNPYFISVFTFNQPPKIERTVQTKALSQSVQLRHQPMVIEAVVTDDVFPFLDSVHLYYRHADDLTFQHAVMRARNDSLFYAAIHTSYVTSPGVEYYIYATDADLESYAPDKLAFPDSLYFIPVGSTLYNEPPIIQRTIETIALEDTAQLYGEPLRIAAVIMDTVGHPLQDAFLFYRNANDATYTQAEMFHSESLWWQDIPANVVTNPRVEYYISATDGVDEAVDALASPPEQFPYRIEIMTPNPHPIILHDPQNSAEPDSTLRIVAQVIDTTRYVDLVTFKYWNGIESDSIKMGRLAFDLFAADIPATLMIPPSVSYQIYAWDNWGYSTESPVFTVMVSLAGTVLPNPFTPNHDGFNDVVVFNVPGLLDGRGTVNIYNHRGRQVRDLSNTDRWDGRDNNGDDLPPGVYLYAVTISGDVKMSGTLTLIR